MAIEFYCPGCAKLMRTPDETAGRKGKCPNCGLKVQIPAASVASPSLSTESRGVSTGFGRPAGAAAQGSQPPAKIEFQCSSCHQHLAVPAANAGKRGKCPHCGAVMSIPHRSSSVRAAPSGPAETKPRWKGSPTPAAATPAASKGAAGKITFHCPQCARQVSVTATAAGQRGRCPQCQSVIVIPLKSTVAPQPALTDLTPLGNDWLTPLDNTALTPLGSNPLGPTDLNDPLGLGPLASASSPLAAGSNPFATSASSFPQQPVNPYAAPSIGSSQLVRPRAAARSGAHVATMVCGGFVIFYAVLQMIVTGVSVVLQQGTMHSMLEQARLQGGNDAAYTTGFMVGQAIALILFGVVYLLILAGGIQMLRFQTWGLCLAACILTMLPCNCICLLGLPIGVWGIVMLSQSSVRAAFG